MIQLDTCCKFDYLNISIHIGHVYALKLAARKNNLHKMTEKFISSERDTPTFTAYLICIIPFFTDERASKPGGGDFHS